MDQSLRLAFSVLSKQHLLLEHSCPQFCCLSSSGCALITLKCQDRNTASVYSPPSLRTQTQLKFPYKPQDATYMSWGWAGGSRGLEHGSFPCSVCLIPSLKSVGRCSVRRGLGQTSCNTWKGNVIRSGAGFITQTQRLCRVQNFLCGVRSTSGASGEEQGTSGLLAWGFLRHTDLDQWTGEAGLEECESSWRVWGSEHLEGDVREAPARQRPCCWQQG